MESSFAVSPMMKDEQSGPDSIVSVELLEALEDYGIGKIAVLLNEESDTGKIPSDVSKYSVVWSKHLKT